MPHEAMSIVLKAKNQGVAVFAREVIGQLRGIKMDNSFLFPQNLMESFLGIEPDVKKLKAELKGYIESIREKLDELEQLENALDLEEES